MPYKYLNNPIILNFELDSEFIGSNINYIVTDVSSGIDIYEGSVYITGGTQTIFLNDIINILVDNYSWFKDDKTVSVINNAPITINLKITFETGSTFYVSDIICARDYPNATGQFSTPTDFTTLNSYGTGVIPRIPKLIAETDNFFSMFTYVYPSSAAILNGEYLNLVLNDKSGSRITDLNRFRVTDTSTPYKKIVYGPYAMNIIANHKTRELGTLEAQVVRGSTLKYPSVTVAYIDNEPADYYISWINRFGTWQCQPLCAKWEMKEKVSTENIITFQNETIPCSKTSEFSWTLNTHWLTYAEHEEFESLLHSKYVYLYSTKYNQGHFVNVTDSNWTFKNNVNTNKPFNLTVNLTKSTKQNINL